MLRVLAAMLLFLSAGCFYAAQQVPLAEPQLVPEPSVVVAAPPVELPAPEREAAVPVPEPVPEVTELLPPQPVIPASPPVRETSIEPPPVLPYAGDFPLAEHPRVTKLLDFYTGNGRRTFARWLERAGQYIPDIRTVFAEEGLPLDLAYLAMIESGFNVRAYSWAHAAGPWQFIESTGKLYGLQNDWWRDDRCHIEKATRAAARHLKYLHQRFDGDWYLAVAAYNAGGGKIRKAIRASNSRDFWALTEGKVLREETRNYLPKLLAALKVVKDLDSYGFVELEYQQPLAYELVTIPTSTDLELIAEYCDVDYAVIKSLNPELKRWCTPPGLNDYQLKVPAGTAARFQERYDELPPAGRASYHRHKIKQGDTLLALAKKYRIQVDDIIALNKITNPRALKLGRNLILPLKEGFTRLPIDELADSYQRSRRRTYTVRSGDSLWTIAQRFGVTEKQLRVWNRLGWSNLIRPGQTLAVAKAGKRTLAKAKRPAGPAKKVVYKVRPGDTLWGIGRQFDVETEMIQLWNQLSKSHVLRPGQKLTLMVPTSRQG